VLTLNKVVPNSVEAQKNLLFLPTKLTAGIELSDDPLPSVRAAAYGVSFGRRSQPTSASSGRDNMSGRISDAATQSSTVSR
jgi:catalase